MENSQMHFFKFFVCLFLCVLFFSACNSKNVKPVVNKDAVVNSSSVPVNKGMAAIQNSFFTDTVPCNGCPGIVYQLFLTPDTTFMFSEEFLGQKQRPALYYGRFNQNDSLLTLLLSKSRQVKFLILDTGMLMLNADEQVSRGKEDFVLEKDLNGEFDLSQSYIVEGGYFYNASGAVFTPCGQSAFYPVNPGGGSFEAEEIFLNRSRKNKGPVYLRAQLKIMEGKDLAGMEKVMVFIEKVKAKIDSTDCR
jgi:hypothetical protein